MDGAGVANLATLGDFPKRRGKTRHKRPRARRRQHPGVNPQNPKADKNPQYQILEGCDTQVPPTPPATDMKVINLSDFPLEERHIKLLSKGLSFSPATPMDKFTAYKDINLFLR